MEKTLNDEACKAAKYFFSLPFAIRELISHHSGDSPMTLEGMIQLSRQVVSHDRTANFERMQVITMNQASKKVFSQAPKKDFVPRAEIICYPNEAISRSSIYARSLPCSSDAIHSVMCESESVRDAHRSTMRATTRTHFRTELEDYSKEVAACATRCSKRIYGIKNEELS